jgi:exodeoxyribonuclease VII large subunit
VDFTISDFVADLRAPTPSAAAEMVVKSKAEFEAHLDALGHRLRRVIAHKIMACRGELKGLTGALKDPSLLIGHGAQRLDDLDERLERGLLAAVKTRRERLVAMQNHLRLSNPAVRIERGKEMLMSLAARSEKAVCRVLERNREAAAVNSAKLHALSPLTTLSRGFAVVAKLPENTVVFDGRQLRTGDRLHITFRTGTAAAVVEKASDG